MNRVFLTVMLPVMLLMAVTVNANALSVTYDESVDGDLSDDQFNPTFVTLFPDVSKVLATTTWDPLDRDFLTITVPEGQVLSEIIWGLYDSTEDLSFFAVQEGTEISSLVDPTLLLGTALIGADQVATDILDDLGRAKLGGIGFSGGLGPGDYTFWFQENTADVAYGYTFVLSSAIPEPTMGIVPAFFGLAVLSRRRRNK